MRPGVPPLTSVMYSFLIHWTLSRSATFRLWTLYSGPSSADSDVFSHLLLAVLTCIAFVLCRDFGGKLRFNGQVTTVKCFENNPLVRKVTQTVASSGHWKSGAMAVCAW